MGMKKFFSILLSPILALLILGIGLPTQSEAAQFNFEKGTINEDSIIYENLYIINSTIDVKGIIKGDLAVFGNDITIQALVDGDAYIFGNSVEILENTRIGGNLILLGNNTFVKGIVDGNTITFANIHKNSSNTAKDLLVFARSNVISGNVGEDARVFAETSTIDSNIGGELIINASESDVNETKIGKNIYTKEDIVKIAKEQGVDLEKKELDIGNVNALWTRFSSALIGLVGMFAAGALILFMAPVKSLSITKKITSSPRDFFISTGLGFAILFFGWIPMLFLLFTVIGIPVATLLAGFVLFGVIFGKVWINLAIGREILRIAKTEERSPYLALLVGGGVSAIIGIIPILSDFYSLIAMTTALGAMVRMKMDKLKEAK